MERTAIEKYLDRTLIDYQPQKFHFSLEDQQLTCEQCPYCTQDVDAYPCVSCHTRIQ